LVGKAPLTHPAALRARPSLRLRRKEGREILLFKYPLFALAQRGEDERSDVGVSRWALFGLKLYLLGLLSLSAILTRKRAIYTNDCGNNKTAVNKAIDLDMDKLCRKGTSKM